MKHIQNAAKNRRVLERTLKNMSSISLDKLAVAILLCLVSACGFESEQPSIQSGVNQNSYAEVTHGAGTVCSELSGSTEVPEEGINCLVVNEPPEADSEACVDGVCCDSPCDGICQACDLLGPDGEGPGYVGYC